MKLITYELNGKQLYLLLNGEALFDCYDKLGREKSLLEHLEAEDKAGFENMVWMLCELAMQGELYRRYQGEDRGPILTYGQAITEILPTDIPQLKLALSAAIRNGFLRENPSDEDQDPWLAEIDQKKKKPLRGQSISEWLRERLGSRSGRA